MAGEFQHILYRQSENEPGTFYFIPGDPGPELTPSGAPAASMILSDSAGILQLGVHWDVTPDQMKAFKAGELYVNVHSADNKGGEIRAQLK